MLFQEGKDYEPYEGELKPVALVNYFDELTGSAPQETKSQDNKDSEMSDLKIIGPQELEAALSSQDIWLIAFMGADDAPEAGWMYSI